MARVGFIHDKLDIKFLILYIMSRVALPSICPLWPISPCVTRAWTTLISPRLPQSW